ncbi:Ig-like domain-containing protein [bacterium]|nr:Ig-like domain-containing protein [bacterium]
MKHYLFFVIFLLGCATVKPPDGGPEDTIAPKVVSTFPDSAQTNISPRTIEIEFDEFIKTKDANKLLIISPNPSTPPKYSIKKKSLIIEFQEDLIPNSTYNVMINGAVVDNNAGNPVSNYQLTFSTGAYIDSLSYTGVVIDAFSKQACDHCMLYMYRNLNDSLPLIGRPDYVANTSGSGRAEIKFLPKDTFMVYALHDENKNLKVEHGELISLGKMSITDDSMSLDTFYIFPFRSNKKPIAKQVKVSYPGVFKLAFEDPLYIKDQSFKLINKAGDTFNQDYKLNLSKDTLTSFIPLARVDSSELVFLYDTHSYSYFYAPKVPPTKGAKYKAIQSALNTIRIQSKQAIDTVNFQKIRLKVDTTEINIDSSKVIENEVFIYFSKTGNYKLILEQGAIKDINGTVSAPDTLILPDRSSEFTVFTLNVDLPDSNNYILQVLKSDKVIEQIPFTSSFNKTYNSLTAGKYRIRIITDGNNNGIWDPGDFILGVESESIFLSEQIELRANWDKELIINKL